MSRFFFIFLTLLFALCQTSFGADNPYFVDGISASFTGKSPSDARNGATTSARKDAFLVLITRLGLSLNVANSISNEEISDMIRSEQIDGEKIAGNNYSATFNIVFARDFVEHILAKKDLKKAEKSSETYLLIPVKMTDRSMILWEENNDWKNAIEKNLNKKSYNKFIVPSPDLANVATINSDNIASADYISIEPMLTKYKADAAYILLFYYDDIENKVNINVSGFRKSQKKLFKLGFVNVDRLSYENLLNKVASKTVNYLTSLQDFDGKSNIDIIHVQIPISSLGNWLMIKNKIENSNLVNQLNIESFSRDYAIVSMTYSNDGKEISEEFAKIGLALTKKTENFYLLTN